MPDNDGKLYLFEALALREAYDQRITLLEKLLDPKADRRSGLRFGMGDSDELQAVAEFRPEDFEAELKKLKTRRVKLNQEIQIANFRATLPFDGEEISLAQALELRKTLLAERTELAQRVVDSAYNRVIHKEERDVVKAPTRPFRRTHDEFLTLLERVRALITAIQRANHTVTVAFRDE